jgi:hypothetical protein
MAQKLLQYYEFVKKEAGFDGQMRLAMRTMIASTKASAEPDSPENIAKFRAAIKELTGKEAPVL